jgi:hypothetical protein
VLYQILAYCKKTRRRHHYEQYILKSVVMIMSRYDTVEHLLSSYDRVHLDLEEMLDSRTNGCILLLGQCV